MNAGGVHRKRATHPLQVFSLDRRQELLRAGARESERRPAARIVEALPHLFQPPCHGSADPAYVGGIRDTLHALQLIGVGVAADQPVGTEHHRHARAGQLVEILKVVRHVACEAARVVAEEDVEATRLGVGHHAAEVAAFDGVLAADQVNVLEAARDQPIAGCPGSLLIALNGRPVAVGLSARRLPDVAGPTLAGKVIGAQVGGMGREHVFDS
ncbi:MAG: hypothetical protein WKH68_03930 [Candidatus Limnocylindria bacterium]